MHTPQLGRCRLVRWFRKNDDEGGEGKKVVAKKQFELVVEKTEIPIQMEFADSQAFLKVLSQGAAQLLPARTVR